MIDTAVSNFNALESNNIGNVWFEKGNELANLGSYTEALVQIDQAVSFQPDNNAAWVLRAVVLIHLQRYTEALASCDRALEIDNSDRQAWLFRGAALNYLGRYKDCYASYDKVMGVERLSVGQRLSQRFTSIFNHSGDRKTSANAISVSPQA